jgi:hypothetical protein
MQQKLAISRTQAERNNIFWQLDCDSGCSTAVQKHAIFLAAVVVSQVKSPLNLA